ncbi:MAG: hypothetical protein A2X12_09210 [Bacteroidetes bacterium GWE2_29_8]|nr:MAG: hypothetical protein A2X12_09210 [Bacteroidetes bacterium GWE2_29_8]
MKTQRLIFLFFLLFIVVTAKSQKFKIESILVDACVSGGGSTACSQEGANEMVRFRIGADTVLISELFVTWPNNSFRGFCLDKDSTDDLTNQLNSTITTTCGILINPVSKTNNKLPPNSNVLVVTSSDMCVDANSFSELSDTLYLIFQKKGNTAGHFANYNSTSGIRTLKIKHTPSGYISEASYNRSLLVKQDGTHGAEDGARVDYNSSGNASYHNEGCKAPVSTMEIDTTTLTKKHYCNYDTITLKCNYSGKYIKTFWNGANGTFINQDSLIALYIPSKDDSGKINLYVNIITTCNDTLRSSLSTNIVKIKQPLVTAIDTVLCFNGDKTFLIGDDISEYNYQWIKDGSVFSTGTYNTEVTDSGYYKVVYDYYACYDSSATTKIIIKPIEKVLLSIVGDTIKCYGDSIKLSINQSFYSNEWYFNGNIDKTNNMFNYGSLSGEHFVIVHNEYGCTDTSNAVNTQILSLPLEPTVLSPIVYCQNTQADSLNAIGKNLKWYVNDTTSAYLNYPPIPSTTIIDTSFYYVSQTNGICESKRSKITVIIISKPNAMITNIEDSIICNGDSSLLSATFGKNISYTWLFNDQPIFFQNNLYAKETGYYSVIIDYNGCVDTSAKQFINIKPILNPPVANNYIEKCQYSNNFYLNAYGDTLIWYNDNNHETTLSTPLVLTNDTGVFNYYVAEKNGNCYSEKSSIIVKIKPLIKATPYYSRTVMCPEDSVFAQYDRKRNESIAWKINNITISNDQTIYIKQKSTIQLIISMDGCVDTSSSQLIDVYTLQPFDAGSDKTINKGESYTISINPIGLSSCMFEPENYFDYPYTFSSECSPIETTKIFITVEDYNNCKMQDSLTIFVKEIIKEIDNTKELIAPNVITPNDDGINDRFEIKNIEFFEIKKLLVFNRYGNVVYSNNNYNNEWGGETENNDQLSDGTYFFLLTYDKGKELKGTVTILR